ncbi:hypothetical protein K8M07_03650 [Schnuerera sp. xch1]|uniref:hypothetical protein n=1 Tax=Schnuerera sp. xch1 TaxID=2874283 RepID=UPI001CBE5E3A|nr:hypothetical protein [Schnuerera sp. xch1]MBZ2174337.1 hypothetical protein [Schnuerera sp. xch1]
MALNCTLGYYTKKNDEELLHATYYDQSAIMPVNGASLLWQAATDQETITVTGKAVKE